jgi:hypothetical protein
VVAVEDVVADDDDAQPAAALQQVVQVVVGQSVAPAQPGEFLVAQSVGRRHAADERGRGVDHVAVGEDDAPAVPRDDLALGEEAGVGAALVLAALHVHVRPHRVEQPAAVGSGFT